MFGVVGETHGHDYFQGRIQTGATGANAPVKILQNKFLKTVKPEKIIRKLIRNTIYKQNQTH